MRGVCTRGRTFMGLSAGVFVVALISALGANKSPAMVTGSLAKPASLAKFEAKVNRDVARGTARQATSLPKVSPRVEAGKKIVVIPCSMAAEGCARQARGAIAAAKTVGWQATLIDPAGDPSRMTAAVQKAISIRADGIITIAIDAATIRGALQQAKKAGISTACWGSIDPTRLCGAVLPSVGSPSPANTKKSYVQEGYLLAQGIYKLTGGHVRMIMLLADEFQAVTLRTKGTKKFITECRRAGGDCKILGEQQFLVTDLATTLPNRAAAFARSHPGFNVLWAGYDAGVTFSLPGLRTAGLADTSKSFAAAFDANEVSLDLIRKNGYQRATIGSPLKWAGYALVDTLNRIFNGQKPVDQGIRSKLLLKSNVPKSGAWDGDFDVAPLYAKLWKK